MKKNKKSMADKKRAGKKPQKVNGIHVLMQEVSRVSYTPGYACFCTPGHNRGLGMLK